MPTVSPGTIPANSIVTLVYGSANRDPSGFPDPDRFDIGRQNGREHFGFGDGIHRCIGAYMAQAVTEAAFEALIQRCPTVRIAEVGDWAPDPYFRSLKKLVLHIC